MNTNMSSNHINWLVAIVIIAIIIVILFILNSRRRTYYISSFTQFPNTDRNVMSVNTDANVNNFRFDFPKRQFANLVSEFGEPISVANKPYGIAIWKNKGPFDVILLMDESIQHNHPEPHCDFLYAIVTVHIPNELVCFVLELSETLTYDKLKNQLTTRCNSMKANVITLYLALKIITDSTNFQYYKSKYDELIALSMDNQTYLFLVDQLGQLIQQNNNEYQSIIASAKQNCLID